MPVLDEDTPRPKKVAHTLGEDLSALSENDLAERIELLRIEIARIEEALAGKKASRSVAASFFRS